MTDRRLVEAFEELAARLPDPPPTSFERVGQRASRRRTWRRVGLAAAAVVLVAVGAVGATALVSSRSDPPVVDQVPATPPPADDTPVTMLLSPQPAPHAGGPLAVVVVNRSEQDFSYGVGGQLDKWEDGAWQPVGGFASALTSWHGTGQVEGGDEPVFKNDIRLSALPRKAGPLEWLSLPRLEPGWYRFTRSSSGDDEQRVAAAILRVSEDAEGPELTAPGDGPVLNVEPAALEPGAHQLRFVLTAPEQNRGEDIPDLRASMAATATLEVWRDSRWRAVAELDVDMDPGEPRGNLHEWAVQLPNLDAGAYRLVQNSNTAGVVVGHLWITELLAEDGPLPDKCGPAPRLTAVEGGPPGNDWVLPLRPGGAVEVDTAISIEEDVRVEELRAEIEPAAASGRATVWSRTIARDLDTGTHNFAVRWDGTGNDGGNLPPGKYHLFAAVDATYSGSKPCYPQPGHTSSARFGLGYFELHE